jgi:hypothetical protein
MGFSKSHARKSELFPVFLRQVKNGEWRENPLRWVKTANSTGATAKGGSELDTTIAGLS